MRRSTLNRKVKIFITLSIFGKFSNGLEILRKEVRSDRFIQRQRIPIQSRYSKLKNVTLAIYEYKTKTKAQPDAVLKMNIPLMNETINVPISDLLEDRIKK